MSKPRVCCAMPCRTVPHPKAFRALQVAAARYGAPLDTPAGEPRDRNRNMCVTQFLQHKREAFDYLLFVDDDTVIPPDAIERLLEVDRSIAVGVQPLLIDGHLVANVMEYPTVERTRPCWPSWVTWKPPQQPYVVHYCGFGCVLIRRQVLERMHFPWFQEDCGDQWSDGNWTEDIYFCRKAHRFGYEVWCQPKVICGHFKNVNLMDIVPRRMLDFGPLESEDGTRHWRLIPGWTPREARELFRQRVAECPDFGTFVELGVFEGRGTCLMAELIAASGKRITQYAVDHFRGTPEIPASESIDLRAKFKTHLEQAGLLQNIKLLESDSAEAAGSFADGSVDFVYVDAGHDRESVRRDIAAWLPKVKPGGVLAGDDYAPEFPDVVSVVDEFFPADAKVVQGRTWAVRLPGGLACDPWGV